MAQSRSITSAVMDLARRAGFARVGIAPAGPLDCDGGLREWLKRGWHGQMDYMAANVEKRHHPALLMDGARSVICLAVSYAPAEGENSTAPPARGKPLVARYARGRNYHNLLKRRCHILMDRIREIEPGFAGRALVDTAPLCERSLAAAAGIGWIGRNGMLVTESLGSYVLLCEIVCNLDLAAGSPVANLCEGCDACGRACPTGALSSDGMVDSRKCISYLTVEHRGDIPPHLHGAIGNRVFGCDSCQEVCPHNRHLPPGEAQLLSGPEPLGGAGLAEIAHWSAEQWDAATRGSATRRATREMFRRNAAIAIINETVG